MTSISFLNSHLGYGGTKRVTTNLANQFAADGYSVDMVAIDASGELRSEISSNIDVIELPASRAHWNVPYLARYLRNTRPDILYSSLTYMNILSLLANELARTSTRVVATEHNIVSDRPMNRKQNAVLKMVPYLYPRADEIIAVSDSVAADFSANTAFPRESIDVIPNAVVHDGLLEQATESPDHPWFESSEVPVILGVGRFVPEKDFSSLVRGFNAFIAENDARLVILGDGQERDRLEQLVTDLDLKDRVSLPGYEKNPYSYMNAASLFVLSSRSEGFPTVLIEALACGCPVISTRCSSGAIEILANGEYGPLVPPGDPAALADEMGSVLNSPPDARDLKDRAHDFSAEEICERYKEKLNI